MKSFLIKKCFLAYSYRIKSFYAHQKIEPVKKWKKIKNIRLVVTGTCLQEGLDKKLVNWAKLNNINLLVALTIGRF